MPTDLEMRTVLRITDTWTNNFLNILKMSFLISIRKKQITMAENEYLMIHFFFLFNFYFSSYTPIYIPILYWDFMLHSYRSYLISYEIRAVRVYIL